MTPHDPDEWMRRLGALPLMQQPGDRWMYNTGSLLQGVLVRRAAQQDLDVFLRERIFEPLGMVNTGFFAPPEKLPRFAGCGYFTDPATGTRPRMDADGAASAYATPPIFPSGAAGLVSTVDDYLRFAQMLLNGGRHRFRRLLRTESVRDMTTDHLRPSQKQPAEFFPENFCDTHGWGYGLSVITARRGLVAARSLWLGRRIRHVLVQRPHARRGQPRDDAVCRLPVLRRPRSLLARHLRRGVTGARRARALARRTVRPGSSSARRSRPPSPRSPRALPWPPSDGVTASHPSRQSLARMI